MMSHERGRLGEGTRGHPKEVHATLNTRRKPSKRKLLKKKNTTDLAMRKQPVIWGLFLALVFRDK